MSGRIYVQDFVVKLLGLFAIHDALRNSGAPGPTALKGLVIAAAEGKNSKPFILEHPVPERADWSVKDTMTFLDGVRRRWSESETGLGWMYHLGEDSPLLKGKKRLNREKVVAVLGGDKLRQPLSFLGRSHTYGEGDAGRDSETHPDVPSSGCKCHSSEDAAPITVNGGKWLFEILSIFAGCRLDGGGKHLERMAVSLIDTHGANDKVWAKDMLCSPKSDTFVTPVPRSTVDRIALVFGFGEPHAGPGECYEEYSSKLPKYAQTKEEEITCPERARRKVWELFAWNGDRADYHGRSADEFLEAYHAFLSSDYFPPANSDLRQPSEAGQGGVPPAEAGDHEEPGGRVRLALEGKPVGDSPVVVTLELRQDDGIYFDARMGCSFEGGKIGFRSARVTLKFLGEMRYEDETLKDRIERKLPDGGSVEMELSDMQAPNLVYQITTTDVNLSTFLGTSKDHPVFMLKDPAVGQGVEVVFMARLSDLEVVDVEGGNDVLERVVTSHRWAQAADIRPELLSARDADSALHRRTLSIVARPTGGGDDP